MLHTSHSVPLMAYLSWECLSWGASHDVPLIGVPLIGVPLIGVPLIGVPLECLTECTSHGLISAPHGRVPHERQA